jgi:DNA-binding transcriptional LysR family regulator
MDLLSVDPVLLRTFRVVMARRSMARAADELGFVPSAVSQHVSRLERLVGTQLLIRTPGEPLAPTAAGRMVDQAAGALLGGMADFVSACRDASGDRVELRIAMYASAACELLPAATVAFKRQHPDAQVRVVQAEPDEGLAALTTGAVDLVIAYRYLADEAHSSPEIREARLGTERLPLVRSAADPDARAEWIGGVRGRPSRRLLEQWASVSGIPVDVRYEAEDPHIDDAPLSGNLPQRPPPSAATFGCGRWRCGGVFRRGRGLRRRRGRRAVVPRARGWWSW